MDRILFAPVLSVLAVTLASSPAVHADDVVSQSCGVLEKTAEGRADYLYDEINDNLLKWGRLHRFGNAASHYGTAEISPNRLPEVVKDFRELLTPKAFALARTLKDLRGTLAKGPNPQAESVAERAGAELYTAIRNAEDKSANMKKTLIDKVRYGVSGYDWNWTSLSYTLCGTELYLEPPFGKVAICGVIDLASGKTSFVVEQRDRFDLSGTRLADLGEVEPVDAYNSPIMAAMIRAQLRVRELSSLPAECRQQGKDGVAQVETERGGAKSRGSDGESPVRPIRSRESERPLG